MSDQKRRLYEGMFLLDHRSGADLKQAGKHVRDLLHRVGAEIEVLTKWDERKLAYSIEGQKRGTFLLTYFRVDGAQIAEIERLVNLSEELLRCLLIRADHIGETELDLAKREAEMDLEAELRSGEDGSSESEETASTETAATA